MRLVFAAACGGVLGYQRELVGKAAGLRTHMLVCVGAAMLLLVPERLGFDENALSRVVQGIVTGIGFIGGGAILKLSEKREIHGLTTAANIWLTAAIGVAAGLGRLGSALITTVLALVILTMLQRLESDRNG